ncbi:hypothetical protein Tco_1499144 [Tanacetum coccineum]
MAVAMSVVYVLTTPILEDGENATMDQIKRRNKWDNDDYVCRGLILKDLHNIKHKKEELTLVELGSHLRIEESLRAQDNDKPKGNNVVDILGFLEKLEWWFEQDIDDEEEEDEEDDGGSEV